MSEYQLLPEGSRPLGRGCRMAAWIRETGIAACWIVIIIILEPWVRLGVISVTSRGLTALGAGCCMVAWIRGSSYQGALNPAWGNVCCIPMARVPLGEMRHSCMDSRNRNCGLLDRENSNQGARICSRQVHSSYSFLLLLISPTISSRLWSSHLALSLV